MLVAQFLVLVALQVSVEPASLPAQGGQLATLRLDRAGMVHLSARSEAGTACVVVDHLRGPFAQAGQEGRENCELDLFLDAGVYRVRLTSPARGKGQVTLGARAFEELAPRPVALEPGQVEERELAPGQQVSYWVRVPARGPVALRVVGRTAGLVRLWRDGEWIEELAQEERELSLRPGQPQRAWLLRGVLEAGDYRLTVYGTAARRWTEGQETNALQVAHGFPPAPAERALSFVLPATGQLAVEVPRGRLAAFLALDRAPEHPVSLEVWALGQGEGRFAGLRSQGTCSVAPRAVVPACQARSLADAPHALTLSGPPGAAGLLRWAGTTDGGLLADDLYARASGQLSFEAPEAGEYLVSVDDVPMDPDAPPLGCLLESTRRVRRELREADFLELGPGRRFERSFNHDGHASTIWFELGAASVVDIQTGGGLGTRCELFRFEGAERRRLASSEDVADKACRLRPPLAPGRYELRLYEGQPGIERLSLAPTEASSALFGLGAGGGGALVTKAACRLERVALEAQGRYRVVLPRVGQVGARGLHLRRLPLDLTRPLPLTLEAGERLRLPVDLRTALEVRAVGGAGFTCALASGARGESRGGVCRLPAPAGRDELSLENPGGEALGVVVLRARPPVARQPLQPLEPRARSFPALAPGQALRFDFERGQAHSAILQVAEPGLYHLTTEGLLATECRVRTPVFSALFSDQGSGRGRNCLVASYLRPGRYLLTATALGASRGRAGLRVSARRVVDKLGVAGEGESFFRAQADELVLQRLTVKAAGPHRLGTVAQGVGLQCRFEDREGWPLRPVPSPCQLQAELEAGEYRWMQLPLTVESMRRTYLEPVRPPRVLAGEQVHPIGPNRVYACELGPDGKDEFRFALAAELDLGVRLTDGMQARLLRVVEGKPDEVVELIPPQAGELQGGCEEGDCGAGDGDGESYDEGGEGGEDGEDGEEDGYERRARHAPPRPGGPPPLVGKELRLPAGSYRLVSEHARGDVGIRYELELRTRALAPGVGMELPVPGRVELRVPSRGVVRLRTEGQADVRCRLFDPAGRLLAEGSEVAADWNCLVAVPLEPGDYRLELEAENGRPGTTRASVDTLSTRPVEAPRDGQILKPEGQVLELRLPAASAGVVQEVGLRSRLAFSCSLEDEAGRELSRQLDVLVCGALIHPQGRRHVVRVWNRRWSADVALKLVERPIEATSGRVAAGRVGRARIPASGLYRTADKVWCAPAGRAGLLAFCGPQASFEAGEVLFSTTGPDARLELALEEVVAELGARVEVRLGLDGAARPRLQRQRSARPSLHLVELASPPGEPWPPACRLEGGVARAEGAACFAASGPREETLAALWLDSASPRPALLARRAVPAAVEAEPLAPGDRRLVWSGPAARFRLPPGGFRLELTLPADGWAVLTDAAGAALDVCPPAGRLASCALSGQGGEVWLVSDAARQARARLLTLERPEARAELGELLERWPVAPGALRIAVRAAPGARRLEVRGAERCRLALEDGRRLSGCSLELPAGQGAALEVVHGAGPLQAVLAPPERLLAATFGVAPGAAPAPALAPGAVASLSGPGLERSLELERPAVVRVRAESGVCALSGPGGLEVVSGAGQGCDLHRLLAAGVWRVSVRAFAGRPLAGGLSWSAEAPLELVEGVGQEDWVAPGEVRLYRFSLRSDGEVGLGLRAEADVLECAVLDEGQRLVGEGCQQFLRLRAGSYLLLVRTGEALRPARFRPVLLGLAGGRSEVPAAYLRDFFQRIGFQPAGGER